MSNKLVPELISADVRRTQPEPLLLATIQCALAKIINNSDIKLPNTWDVSLFTSRNNGIPTATFNVLAKWLDDKGYHLEQHQATERQSGGYGGDSYDTQVWRLSVDYK